MKIQELLHSSSYKAKSKGEQLRQLRENAITRLLVKNSEITSMMVVQESGLDVSVARSTLKKMEQAGILIRRVGGEQRRSFYYSMAGLKPLKVRWVPTDNGAVLGMHRPIG